MRTHVDLFSGIGGFALAAQWAGYETVLFVEIDPWCQKVLKKHWPNVPIIGDIRDVNEETVTDAYGARQEQRGGNIRQASQKHVGTLPGTLGERRRNRATTLPTIDLLTGGFPCQPFSVAGKRGGTSDDRYLWPEMCRVIGLLKPRWVIAENVRGLLTIENGLVFERVLSDMEALGYEVQPLVIPACAVNAPHRRDRVWIVAHATRREGDGRERGIMAGAERCGQGCDAAVDVGREDVADTDEQGPQGYGRLRERADEWFAWSGSRPLKGMWELEPSVLRVANGIPRRVDRLRGLGNAIVPQVAYEIIRQITEVSNG